MEDWWGGDGERGKLFGMTTLENLGGDDAWPACESRGQAGTSEGRKIDTVRIEGCVGSGGADRDSQVLAVWHELMVPGPLFCDTSELPFVMFLRLSMSLPLCRCPLANENARGQSRERNGGKTRGAELCLYFHVPLLITSEG